MYKNKSITESESSYRQLEKMSLSSLLKKINKEDHTVPSAVRKSIPEIEKLVSAILQQMKKGGRLFYIGAGTSGRLGIVDASECPPTFGVSRNKVIGLIAGGDKAIRKAVEHAEDNIRQGWNDLLSYKVNTGDLVVGIAASGTTPYVVAALRKCNSKGIPTGCITCNPGSPLQKAAKYPVVAAVGPEFVTGSSRMKAGTAQKLILNMISTSVMIKLGHVKGNRMVDMRLTNEKLIKRGTRMIVTELKITPDKARTLLLKYKSVRKAIDSFS